jgi:hypothetical protein
MWILGVRLCSWADGGAIRDGNEVLSDELWVAFLASRRRWLPLKLNWEYAVGANTLGCVEFWGDGARGVDSSLEDAVVTLGSSRVLWC